MVNPQYKFDQTEFLAHFIRDVRAEFKTPKFPFVIGQIGINGGSEPGTNESIFRAAQAAGTQMLEFVGNVKLVVIDPFWDYEAHAVYKKGWREHFDEWNKVGSDYAFLCLGSAKTNCQTGRAFGEAMIELCRSGAKR